MHHQLCNRLNSDGEHARRLPVKKQRGEKTELNKTWADDKMQVASESQHRLLLPVLSGISHLESKAAHVQMRAFQQLVLLQGAAQVSDRRRILLFHHLLKDTQKRRRFRTLTLRNKNCPAVPLALQHRYNGPSKQHGHTCVGDPEVGSGRPATL